MRAHHPSVGGGAAENFFTMPSNGGTNGARRRRGAPETSSFREPRPPEINSRSFAPETLATTLTLLDLPAFKAIQPEELSSVGWNKKNKREIAPNVVALIRRFNHVSFWAAQEVLSCSRGPRQRADAMAHLIRLAKRLHELNNLHAEFAVLSALQSAAIYRLTHSWAQLSRRDRQSFDKLASLFSETDNFSRLRDHMNSVALRHDAPCIPYLGLYLTDLVYIDMAHPHSGGLESQQRRLKMNNILRIVSELQRSTYDHLQSEPRCERYLRSVSYIDELQKFIEEDNYKLSLKLEPKETSTQPSSSSSRESVISRTHNGNSNRDPSTMMAELNLSPAKSSSSSNQHKKPFVPGHRKCRSDGANIFLACAGGSASDDPPSWTSTGGTVTSSSAAGSEEKLGYQQHHLLDDSLLDDPLGMCKKVGECQTVMEEDCKGEEESGGGDDGLPYEADSEKLRMVLDSRGGQMSDGGIQYAFQGCIKRKTLIKEGRRPKMASSWQRYWAQIWGEALVYYAPKTLTKGLDRRDFRTEPCKYHELNGWLVVVEEDGKNEDSLSFQLTHPARRTVYRFRAPTPQLATGWMRALQAAVGGAARSVVVQQSPPPTNLISFE